jgi:D-2-hydroxyacid dehydrogenase (NADP+)
VVNKLPGITVYLTSTHVPCWNFSAEHYTRLQSALPGVEITLCSSSAEFREALDHTHVGIVWRFKEEWLALAPRLEWLVTPAAGRDYFYIPPSSPVDVDYCTFHGELMGETVLGMMLAHVRGIMDAQILQQEYPWPRKYIWKHMRPLRGAHCVILGFGHIGSWIGKLAKGFGMRITGVKRKFIPHPPYFDKDDTIITVSDLDAVLPHTDHLVCALPGGEETTDIIDEKRLSLLPAHAVIYNVGRGNAISEDALVESITHNKIEAAYLDVVKTEPLAKDSPLRNCPGIFVMPHASAISPNYLDLFINEFVEKYKARYIKALEY